MKEHEVVPPVGPDTTGNTLALPAAGKAHVPQRLLTVTMSCVDATTNHVDALRLLEEEFRRSPDLRSEFYRFARQPDAYGLQFIALVEAGLRAREEAARARKAKAESARSAHQVDGSLPSAPPRHVASSLPRSRGFSPRGAEILRAHIQKAQVREDKRRARLLAKPIATSD